jgi:hypothetical protein
MNRVLVPMVKIVQDSQTGKNATGLIRRRVGGTPFPGGKIGDSAGRQERPVRSRA